MLPPLIAAALLLTFGAVQLASAQTPTPGAAAPPIPNDTCLSCHRQQDMEWVLPSGEILSMTVDHDQLNASVHSELACQDCHSDIAGYPHGEPPIGDHRDLQVYYSQSCANCHAEQAEAQVDSVHAQVRAAGIDEAAVCADCHGSHNIQPISREKHPEVPLTSSAETCKQCHSSIHEEFVGSVHGQALYAGSKDVPACIYCHPAHTAEDPRTVDFRLQSPQICGSCHADEELMAQYGISTEVFDTYVSDFHGTTVMLFEKTHPDQPTNKAVCIDCHGVHNIANTEDELALKENLIVRCRECHPDATTNFAGSWLGHYTPTWENYPLLTAVTWFYRILIPGVLAFFLIYIAVDAQRRIRDRRAARKEQQA
jgi:predicted CXXCH cytochrome family protein